MTDEEKVTSVLLNKITRPLEGLHVASDLTASTMGTPKHRHPHCWTYEFVPPYLQSSNEAPLPP